MYRYNEKENIPSKMTKINNFFRDDLPFVSILFEMNTVVRMPQGTTLLKSYKQLI